MLNSLVPARSRQNRMSFHDVASLFELRKLAPRSRLSHQASVTFSRLQQRRVRYRTRCERCCLEPAELRGALLGSPLAHARPVSWGAG